MFKPSPTLNARLRFTTKQVARGFYRGNRTGSLGAHTEYGGYIIDWRKVRHFVVPDLAKSDLTPFVSKEINAKEKLPDNPNDDPYNPEKIDAIEFLRLFREKDRGAYDQIVEYQANRKAST